MAHYPKVQLHNVPDQHLYGSIFRRAWRVFWRASGKIRLALVIYGISIGMLFDLIIRRLM